MSNYTTPPSNDSSGLWSAIVAKLVANDHMRAKELSDILDVLPEGKKLSITEKVVKFSADQDLNLIDETVTGSGRKIEDRFRLYSGNEAFLPHPAIDWIVNPIYSPGTLSVLYGDPGSKKTYAMLDLAVCIANGLPWLNFPTKLAPILLIDEESGKNRIDIRLKEVLQAKNISNGDNIHYVTLASLNLLSSEDVAVVGSLIEATHAKFIIVDAMVDIMHGADENSATQVQPLLMNLRQIAAAHQCAIVMIHHSNRNGGIRGTSAINGAVDTMIFLENLDEGNTLHFVMKKNRDGEPLSFSAKAYFEPGKFWLSPTAFQKKASFTPAQELVLKFLLEKEVSTVRDFSKEYGDATQDSIRKSINDLCHTGHVVRVDTGGSGKLASYSLTETGKAEVVALL